MYEPSEPPSGERSQAGPTPPSRDRAVPPINRRTTTQFGWRHVTGVAFIRFLVAVWLVCLGAIFCAFGDWWGAFLFVGAALVGSLVYLMPRWKAALDAEKSGPARP